MNVPFKNTPDLGVMDWKKRQVKLRSQNEMRISVPFRFTEMGIQALYDDFLLPFWNNYIKTGEGDINEKNLATREHIGIVGRLTEAIRVKLERRYGKDRIPFNLRVEMEPDPWCITKEGKQFYFQFRIRMEPVSRWEHPVFPDYMMDDL